MKIAIMTQPLGKNYGGIMQAWALQQVLKEMGHDPITIDRQSAPRSPLYRMAQLSYRFALNACGKRNAPINFERRFDVIYANTNRFVDNNILMSDRIVTTRGLEQHFAEKDYNAVIVGSDQTWRPRYSPNIYNFFLDFIEREKIKRIAYATSFGVSSWEFTEDETKRCSELVKLFDAIGVREDTGIDLCKRFLDVQAVHVLDPTLLISREDYINLIGEGNLIDECFGVYTYFLDKDPVKNNLSERFSEHLGEPVFNHQARLNVKSPSSKNIEDYVMPDVKKWLSGFAKAKFVLTDSFHGIVFSIIFGKPFAVIDNKKRGSTRFDSILKILDMNHRIIKDDEVDCDAFLKFDVENDIKDHFLSFQKDSKEFIYNALN
jgi:polysaccharide pyruvyl transferase